MSNKPFNPTISISRADYKGRWQDFLADNAPFFSDDEIERIELALRTTGSAIHTALSAGDFEFVAVK